MTAANLWYSGSMKKADNKQKKGPNFQYQYNASDPGYIALHQAAVICSVANFDRSLPSQKTNAINNSKTLTPQ